MDKRKAMYDILGVPFGAGTEELKDAYRRLAKKYHPDLTRNLESGRTFAKIVNAYKTLSAYNEKKSIIDFPVKETKRSGYSSAAANTSHDIFSLGKLLCEGKTVSIRTFAARRLGNCGKRSAYAFLRKALNDSSNVVVKTAVEAIGKLEINQSSGELGSVFSRGDKEVKLAILDTVERIGCKPPFRSIIIEGLKDGYPEVRRRSLSLYTQAKHERKTHVL